MQLEFAPLWALLTGHMFVVGPKWPTALSDENTANQSTHKPLMLV